MNDALEVRLLIEGLSEEHYSAGWHMGVERMLWNIVFKGAPRGMGTGEASNAAIQELKLRAERADAWWYWDDDGDEPIRITLAEAQYMFRL